MKGKPRVKTVQRPWGKFELLALNVECTVKIISVKPGQALSLQSHRRRDEYWVVLDGQGTIQVNGRKMRAARGKQVFIRRGQRHRLSAGKNPVRVLEVSFGKFLEHDEKRFSDRYGRK